MDYFLNFDLVSDDQVDKLITDLSDKHKYITLQKSTVVHQPWYAC